MRREDHCTKQHWRFKEEGRSSSQLFLYSKGRYAVYRSFAYFCEVKKIALWILLTVYGFFALSPTLYIHGCCCGVVQQWIIPPADCCENDPDHHHQIQFDCCHEESVSFHLDANQLPSIFSLSFFNETIAPHSFSCCMVGGFDQQCCKSNQYQSASFIKKVYSFSFYQDF